MSGPVRAVAFDMDGLLFNTELLYEDVGRIMVERRGKQLSYELLSEMMGRPARVSLQRMIDFYGFSDSVAELEAENDEIFADILPQRLEPMPGAIELLQYLSHAAVPCALTTSSRACFVERVMAIHDLSGYFSFRLTAEDVVNGKPDPEIYETAARRFDVATQQMMVLEDSQNGCRAAVAARTVSVAVPGAHSRHHDFSGAVLRADGLTDRRVYQLLRR